MGKTALLFPGQGAQYTDMGMDFYHDYSEAREVFDEASDLMGYSMQELISSGEQINLTEFTQPAILTTSIAILRVLEARGLEFDITAGLSLGEYSALVAAGCLNLSQALPLVRKRGLFMQQAVPAGVGGMCAIVGLDQKELGGIIAEVGGEVWMANFNCPGQIVISGKKESVQAVSEKAKEQGAKMCVDLPLSAPFHTKLLEPAADSLKKELDKIEIKEPSIPVIFNVTANQESKPSAIKDLLRQQVMSPVLFQSTLEKMAEMDVDTFIELGPGSSLKGFIKRSVKKVKILSADTVENSKKVEEIWKK
ncbi:ACP S-malonyltransferase [Clostridia bacterium]|nr:ACP S-malonyltransferase [Clostridia bacterium]